MSTYSAYQPINCEFHDLLEAAAVRRAPVLIQYRDDEGIAAALRSRIVDVFASGGAEYLRLASGDTVRLDQLIAVDGTALADFADAQAGAACALWRSEAA